MRILFIIGLFLQGLAVNGQLSNRQVISLDEALKTASQNNPDARSPDERKKLTCDIKTTWYLWLFSIHKWQTLQEYEVLLGDLTRIAGLRHQSGEFEFLEKSYWMDKIAEVESSAAISANNLAIIENQFRQLLFTDRAFAPADTLLSLYQIDKGEFMGNPPVIQPAIISTTDSLLMQYQSFIKEKTILNKQLELDGLFIRLQYFNTSGLAHAKAIIQISQAKLKNEDIDYIEFVENIAKAFKIKQDYLETLNKYNQSAIQLEYYAY